MIAIATSPMLQKLIPCYWQAATDGYAVYVLSTLHESLKNGCV